MKPIVKMSQNFKSKLVLSTLVALIPLCPVDFLRAEIPVAALQVMPTLNQIYHPVSTNNRLAQESFNQGLTYYWAYNHELAYKEFEKAAALDPNLAIAYWGMALSIGQNVNTDVTPDNEVKAYKLIHKALSLSDSASQNEKDYIIALSKRYTDDPKADFVPLRSSYSDAMKTVFTKYPEDLDAATLYVESLLAIDPWSWWDNDGKPTEGVPVAVDILESILQRNPYHIGANHYYIHAMEESPFPERALMSAHRLESLDPEGGHLLHMPCHIFNTVGDYESAIKTNTKAIAVDKEYIRKYGLGGDYPLHYLPHNYSISVRTRMLMSDYAGAIKTAEEFQDFLAPHMEDHENLHHYAYIPLEVYLYFHKWDEILLFRPLACQSPIVQSYLHFSRGIALAAQGKIDQAEKEQELFNKIRDEIPKDTPLVSNTAEQVFDIANVVLKASISRAKGDNKKAIELMQKAVAMQDNLHYSEPPAWFMPTRQILGSYLLEETQYKEAEDNFRTALKKLRRNGRLLVGLTLALKGQERHVDAYWTAREAKAALKNATGFVSQRDL